MKYITKVLEENRQIREIGGLRFNVFVVLEIFSVGLVLVYLFQIYEYFLTLKFGFFQFRFIVLGLVLVLERSIGQGFFFFKVFCYFGVIVVTEVVVRSLDKIFGIKGENISIQSLVCVFWGD